MKVELQQRHLPSNKNGNLPLDITSLQYHHTDDQKLQASTDDRSNANLSDASAAKLSVTAPRAPMPLDLLEPCSSHHSRSCDSAGELSNQPTPAGFDPRSVGSSATPCGTSRQSQQPLDPDIVRQPTRVDIPVADVPAATNPAYQMDISPEESTVLLQPLTEAALIRRASCTGGGVDLMADIPMIDADDDADVDPAASVVAVQDTQSVSPPSDPAPGPVVPTILKSALKKGARPAAKKGMRVCFQSTSTFYIDTDAEANAEPQLMLVQSLDLPLVSAACTTDFRLYKQQQQEQAEGSTTSSATTTITTTTTTTTGSGPHEKKYTYEDAIVSLEHYSDILGPDRGGAHYSMVADKVLIGISGSNAEDTPDGASAVSCPVSSKDSSSVKDVSESDVGKSSEPDVRTVLCTGKTGEADTKVEQPSVLSTSVPTTASDITNDVDLSVQSLTVANLRLHEILMEPDAETNQVDSSDSAQPQQQVTPTMSVEVVAATQEAPSTTSSGTNLSPPLKELTVDVLSVVTPGAGESAGANWQVELSPLNSIPESETDSSNSSQDTIIMMTSEESERNEKQIQRSLVARQQHNGDTAASSSDSDDTVKCVESGLDSRSSASALSGNGSDDGRQCTASSSEIRQIMERNAIRRSQLRYSNTQKKKSEGGAVVPSLGEKHQQRTWKSQESLLDTIKLLTSDDDSGGHEVEQNDQERTHRHHHKRQDPIPRHQELPPPRVLNGSSRSIDSNNLSLQDIRGLIAAVNPIRGAGQVGGGGVQAGTRGATSNSVAVPGDIRQWKIQANMWDSVRGRRQLLNGQQEPPPSVAPNKHNNAGAVSDEERTRWSAVPDTIPRVSEATPAPVPSEEEDHYGYYGANGYLHMDEGSDELARFVHNDSDRLERLRKRYSYTDGEEYDSNRSSGGAFGARRPSVRGIKPRFGSTSEILKQMQGLLHTPPLANPSTNGHLTWPYPDTNAGAATAGTNNPATRHSGGRHQQRHSTAASDSWMTSSGSYATLPSSFSGGLSPAVVSQLTGSRSVASLPTLHEEIYGVVRDRRGEEVSPAVVRARLGRDGTYMQVCGPSTQLPTQCPPPYQPPPPPPSVNTSQHQQPPPYDHPHHHQQQRLPHQPPGAVHPHLQHQLQHTQPYHLQHQPQQQHNPQYFHPPHPKHYHHHHQQQQQQQQPQYQMAASMSNGDRVPPLIMNHNGPVPSRPLFATTKDERGVPEGASASPKVTFDSLYAHVVPNGNGSTVSHPTDAVNRSGTVTDNSGVVYYAMQV